MLSDAWIRRLWEIAVGADSSKDFVYICGFCLLQSYQMIAELQEHYIRGPLSSGGYFFDTAQGVNSFISFRHRFPSLAERLEGLHPLEDMVLSLGESDDTRIRCIMWMAVTIISLNITGHLQTR